MMEKYFYRRGERQTITQLDEILAVQVETDEDARPMTAGVDIGEPLDAQARSDSSFEIDDVEAEAFAAAGWVFVLPTPTLQDARGIDDALPADVQKADSVFQTETGQTLIGTSSLTVQFVAEMSAADIEARLAEREMTILRHLRFSPNQFEVAIAPGADLLDEANALAEADDTVYCEPTFIEQIGQRLTPTDPTYGQQWHLNNTGGGAATAGADISAEQAWNFTRGEGVRIAVIDHGFDADHDDLTDGVTAESGFFDTSNDFQQTLTGFPDDPHGTFCAGMAAARQNNDIDGCGSAPGSEVTLIASRTVHTVGTQVTLARAVAYAADPSMEVTGADPSRGADVIVSSLGPSRAATWALTTTLENAIRFATRQGRQGRGAPLLWAASNGNVNISLDEVVSHADVIAVARSRNNDQEDGAASGPELEFLAPGVNVVSLNSGGGTRTDTGTSFAAPLAAGVAALCLSANPDLTGEQVRSILSQTCDKVGGVTYNARGHHPDYGQGRVNAYQAVIAALHAAGSGLPGLAGAFDSDRPAEVPVMSPWGIGILELDGDTLDSVMLKPNGTRFGGWLLNTRDNTIVGIGDFDGDGRDEILIKSPWGIGILELDGDTLDSVMLKPNGTRFGGWLLNTTDNWFGPVGKFDGDRTDELMVGSPWGIGVLKLAGDTLDSVMLKPNGTRFGGWLLNTFDNRVVTAADFDGDGRDEILIKSPWGVGVLELAGDSLDSVMLKPNGTRFGGWLLNTDDNVFGPFGDFDGDGRDEIFVHSPWGVGILELDGDTLDSVMLKPNGTRFGGWLLNTRDNLIR